MITKPEPGSYNPNFQHYIDLVPDGNFTDVFKANTAAIADLFSNVPADMQDYRYAEGKWTVKDMLQHIIDTERVFGYRMLVAARADGETQLFRMNENHYAAHANASARSMENLLEEFRTVRKSMEFLLSNITEEQSRFPANSAPYKISACVLAYVTAGHALHHANVLKERYLSAKA